MSQPGFKVTIEYIPDMASDPDAYRLHWEQPFRGKTLEEAMQAAQVWVEERRKRQEAREGRS